MNSHFIIWITGYSHHTALSVELVSETEKAYRFKVTDSTKGYAFYMPKSALKKDSHTSGVLNLASWFKLEGFLSFLFDRYASHVPRGI
jgi:hypothetical protein